MENGLYEKFVQSACRKGPAVSSARWKGPALPLALSFQKTLQTLIFAGTAPETTEAPP